MVVLIHGRLDMFMASQFRGKRYQPACTEQYRQHPLWSLQLLLSEARYLFPDTSMRASIQLYPPGLEGSHQVRHTDSWLPQPTA